MNRHLAVGRVISALLFLSLSGHVLLAAQAKPKKHEARHVIDQLEETWRNAVLKSDTSAMSALLSDDYIGITASGTLQTKEETLVNMRNRRLHFTTLDISDRKVRFYGTTAVVTSLAQVQGTTADGDVSGSLRYTRVYVRNPQGQWKIVSFEASRIREPGEHRKSETGTNP
jgi:ketosteroid isomerase-like protein